LSPFHHALWPNFRPIGSELAEKIPEKKKRLVKHISLPLLRSARQMRRDQQQQQQQQTVVSGQSLSHTNVVKLFNVFFTLVTTKCIA